MNQLDVYLSGRRIGTLEDTVRGIVFTYSSEYCAAPRAVPLSFSFPVREGVAYGGMEVESYFSNLLPDDYIRTRIGEILKIPRENTFALLEAIGWDCAGAVAFYRHGQRPEMIATAQYRELTDSEAVQILTNLEKRPLNVGEEGFRISGSGAQDKLVACVRNGHVVLPLNGTPSTHIVKPDIRNYPGSVLNEWFVMRLAAACRLKVAASDVIELEGGLYYVTERYDRVVRNGVCIRLHQEDFCQILNIDPRHKYETQGGPGFAECFALFRRLELTATETLEFLNRVIFNFLVGNGDAHGKNFSLMVHDGKYVLAPMYDLMCTTIYSEVGRRMAMKIDGNYDFKWVTRGKFLRMGARYGFSEKIVSKLIDKMIVRILREADKLEAKCRKVYPTTVYAAIVSEIRAHCDQISGNREP